MYTYKHAKESHVRRKRCEQPLRKTNKVIYNSDTIHRGFSFVASHFTQLMNKPKPLEKIKLIKKEQKILMFE